MLNIKNLFYIFLFYTGVMMAKTPEPKYKVLSKSEKIEIRKYPEIIIAQVKIEGERKESVNKGFRILADYIFGNNKRSDKIEMTAPVMQQSIKIDMTAPVMQEKYNNSWKVSFVMPESFTLESLPKPNNQKIEITKRDPKKFVVIQFSGFNSTKNLDKHLKELNDYIKNNNLKVLSEPIFAFYNPPWTLPFWRRNEIMFALEN